VRIRLELLHFEWNEPRELIQNNVDRLKDVFRLEGINRLQARNHIPAIIDQAHLDAAIQASEIPPARLPSHPDNDPSTLTLPAGYRLIYLHGRHQVQVAREALPPTDAWRTVDLYLTSMRPFQTRKSNTS
jgi:hypothetical protein